MATSVPGPKARLVAGPSAPDHAETLEQRRLEDDDIARKHRKRDADQRYMLRWLAVLVTLTLIGLMVATLCRAHLLFAEDAQLSASPTYIIALLITPVVSLSALAIALLVAAFRGYQDTDTGEAGKAITDVARSGELAG